LGPLPVPRRSTKPAPTVSAFDAGLRMIVGRDHAVAELRRKLGRRGYPDVEIDAAQERLMANGWLGDRRFAERYARRRSRSFGRELVEAAIERLGPHTQYLAAHKLADKLAGNTQYASYRELLHSVGAKLLRRGFSMEVVRKACDGLWPGTSDEPTA